MANHEEETSHIKTVIDEALARLRAQPEREDVRVILRRLETLLRDLGREIRALRDEVDRQ